MRTVAQLQNSDIDGRLEFQFSALSNTTFLALQNSSHHTGYSFDRFAEKLRHWTVILKMGRGVIDTICQRASEMLYEIMAVSLFSLPITVVLATRSFATCMPRSLVSCPSPWIFEQKRDCSWSSSYAQDHSLVLHSSLCSSPWNFKLKRAMVAS